MKKAVTSFLVLLLCATATATAQRGTASLGWSALIPAGKRNLINKTAWVAPSLEVEYHLRAWLSVGLAVGYERASERGMTRDHVGGDLVDGYVRREAVTMPLRVQARWFPFDLMSKVFRPFAAVSAGASYALFKVTGDAIEKSYTANWGTLFSAGLGVRYYPIRRSFFMELAGGWQWRGNHFKIVNTKRQQGAEVRLALGFSL